MTNNKFIAALAKKSKLSVADAENLLNKLEAIIVDSVKEGDTVAMQGLGNFELKVKAERRMYNPATKGYRIIPSSKTMAFRPNANIKDKLNPAK